MKNKKIVILLSIIVLLSGCKFFKKGEGFFNKKVSMKELIEMYFVENQNDSSHYQILPFDDLKKLYELNQFESLWIEDEKPNQKSLELLDLLSHSMYYGLDTIAYNLPSLRNAFINFPDSVAATDHHKGYMLTFELLLSQSGMMFINHLVEGLLSFNDFKNQLNENEKFYIPSVYKEITSTLDLPQMLFEAASGGDLKNSILSVQSQNSQYRNIQKGLENYIKSTTINHDKVDIPYLSKNSEACRKGIAQMLIIHGYLPQENDSLQSTSFKDALINYQTHNGLRNEGEIDNLTVESLRNSTFDNYRKAALALQKIRWSQIKDSNYLFVNIPSASLDFTQNNIICASHRIVVGTPTNTTPELNSNLTYIQLYPEWNVPRSIATKETLPKMQNNTGYIKRNSYEVIDNKGKLVNSDSVDWKKYSQSNFPYRIRQKKGSFNSLGIIKFYFQNSEGVYIHDTPSKSLFQRNLRSFSHGCMRLHNPIDFAKMLLEYNNNIPHQPVIGDWTEKNDSVKQQIEEDKNIVKQVANFEKDLKNGVNSAYHLNKQCPVYIRYLTVYCGNSHKLRFLPDLYYKEKRMLDKYDQLVTKMSEKPVFVYKILQDTSL